MMVSTKGRYALRVMLDLAQQDPAAYVPLKDVAERQGISEKYLEQIISVLSKAGFVTSVRGAGGGYRLSRELKGYTVGMILRATEGSLAPVTCLTEGEPPCERADSCTTLFIWEKIYKAVNDVVDNITLEDLIENEKWSKE